MKKILYYLVPAIFLTFFSIIFLWIYGDTYTKEIILPEPVGKLSDYSITLDQDHDVIKINDVHIDRNTMYVSLSSVSEGIADLYVAVDEYISLGDRFYVHSGGVITSTFFWGECNGDEVIQISICIYLLWVLILLIIDQVRGQRENLYQYKNAGRFGLILFLFTFFLNNILLMKQISGERGIINNISTILSSANTFAFFAFPVAFLTSVLVMISNIILLCREGLSYKNMLGIGLGMLICVGTVIPVVLSEYLRNTDPIDMDEMNGILIMVEVTVISVMYMMVTYMECILAGTIAVSIKAAYRKPVMDKDYIIILGCQINKDGTLTKLLKSRADRALSFAHEQKVKTGKDIIFVPSGGQGSDEVTSEASAIKNYLISEGVPEDRIIAEDKSVNTYENMRNSYDLILRDFGSDKAKIAFSTTNYHVFRSGVIASKQGVMAEGIGSPTKRYFWINAFIREFIAAVYNERKKHLGIITFIISIMVFTAFMIYYFNMDA